MVKVEFPHLFHDDPEWHERAAALGRRTFELSDFLVNQLKVVDVGAKFAFTNIGGKGHSADGRELLLLFRIHP